jgi:hypothetical protein
MYKHFLLFALLLAVFTASAQNKAAIKGRIVDSADNTPVEFVTVAVLTVQDTTSLLYSYTITDKKGMFNLHNLPEGVPLKIFISNVAYRSYRKLITLSKSQSLDLGNVILSPNQLNEVVIKGERAPVVINKDTIEFNVEAFKVRPNAVVEELLKKLPGVEVSNQGEVMVNNKKVKKVLVDGREFFSNDLRIATRNIDADLIDKIQVYDDREDDPDHLVDEVLVQKIINLKFKRKLRKSVFGKLSAGAGTRGRYESGAFFNMFRDTLQVSFLGMSNNLSNTGFDFSDLYNQGGGNRGGAGIFYGGGLNSGINRTTGGGVNINTDYGKKLKVNLAYYYNHGNTNFNTLTSKAQQTVDTTFTTLTNNARNSLDDRHSITASVRVQKDGMQWSYSPTFSFVANKSVANNLANSFSNFIPQVSNSINNDNRTGNNLQFGHSFSYNKQLKKQGSSINIQHGLSINPDNNDDYNITNLTSYVASFPSYVFNRYTFNRNKNIGGDLTVSYRYPTGKKLTAGIWFSENYNQVISKGAAYDFNPSTGLYDVYLPTQSTDLTRNLWKQAANLNFTYAITKKMSLVADVTAQLQSVNNQFGRDITDVDRKYFDVLPSLRLSMGDYNNGSYAISYSQSIGLPYIGDLVPYTLIINPLLTIKGNPDLKQSRTHNLGFNYNINKSAQQIGLNLSAGVSYTQDGIFRERTLSTGGAETTTPLNMDGRYNSNASIGFSKRFKKTVSLQFNSNSRLGFNSNHNFFEVNHQEGYQNIYNTSFNQSFGFNWKDILMLDPSFNVNRSISHYSGVDYNSINYTSIGFQTPFTISWARHLDISGTYSYSYNPLVASGFQKNTNLLNLSISHFFMKKDRAEIKLACYDILNEAISTNRSIYENITNDTQANIIRRYFLLTFKWKFNSVKLDEKRDGPMRISVSH